MLHIIFHFVSNLFFHVYNIPAFSVSKLVALAHAFNNGRSVHFSIIYCAKKMASDNCDHGDWVDGVCICDEGYVSEFTNKELYPVYCAKKYEEVTVVLKGNEIRHLLQYLAISVWKTGCYCWM